MLASEKAWKKDWLLRTRPTEVSSASLLVQAVWGKPILVALLVCGFQARLWVQLMRELRNGVKLKKVQQKQFDPLPTEYQLTPFEMLMQDIRARNYKLRKVMVRGTGTVSSLSGATRWPWAAQPLSGAFFFLWAWPLISLKMGCWQPFPLNLTEVAPKADKMDRILERSRNLSQVTKGSWRTGVAVAHSSLWLSIRWMETFRLG